jgi:16S rRNA U1498 N3-methylase RsmE
LHDLHRVRRAGAGAHGIRARDGGDRRVAARVDRAKKRETRRELATGNDHRHTPAIGAKAHCSRNKLELGGFMSRWSS